MACTNVDEFRKIHNHQLKSIGFPSELVPELFQQLSGEDSGAIKDEDFFTVKDFENSRSILVAKRDIPKQSCFFLVDHIWTNDGGLKASQQLKRSSDLTRKLEKVFNLRNMETVDGCYDLKNQINSVMTVTGCSLEEATKSVEEYKGQTIESTMKCLDKATPDLDKNTSEEGDEISFEEFVAGLNASGNMPENANESFLRKMYNNFSKSKNGCGTTMTYNWEDENDVVTVYVSIPVTAKKNCIKSTLTRTSWKLLVNDKELVNGELFAAVKADDSYWSIESPGVFCMTLDKVLVGDEHTWQALLKGEEKLSADIIIQTAWATRQLQELYHDNILDTMWKFNQTYSLASQNGQARVPQWYIMAKIGSALTHSNHPNFKCSPFIYSNLGRAYSIIWPIKDVGEGAMCTRNFIPQIMANESLEMCKIRLKAFFEKKINTEKSIKDERSEGILPIDEFKEIEIKEISSKALTRTDSKVSLGAYEDCLTKKAASALNLTVVNDTVDDCKLHLLTLDKTTVNIDGDILPTAEMVANRDYFQNYLHYRCGKASWYVWSYILPNNLVEFNTEFEKSDLPQYWLARPVDRRLLQMEKFVSSQFARIIRMSEIGVGSIAISKYNTEQMKFRDRLVVLSYPVFLCPSTKTVFVSKEPCIRLSKEKQSGEDYLDEYNNCSSITETLPALISSQTTDAFNDYKIAMNRLLLPQDPNKGWAYVENRLFKIIGKFCKVLLEDIRIPLTSGSCDSKTLVFFNVDVLIDSSLEPKIVDVNDTGCLPHKQLLADLLTIGLGGGKESFVEINQ